MCWLFNIDKEFCSFLEKVLRARKMSTDSHVNAISNAFVDSNRSAADDAAMNIVHLNQYIRLLNDVIRDLREKNAKLSTEAITFKSQIDELKQQVVEVDAVIFELYI